MNCVDGFKNRKEQERDMYRQLTFEVGLYTRIAVNDPKHYPEKPFPLEEKNSEKEKLKSSDEYREAYVKSRYGVKHGKN